MHWTFAPESRDGRAGLAAAIGLVAFFIGAVGVHIRSNVLHNVAFPGVFLALALGSVAYFTLPD
ncbi:putative invasion protein [Mycobacteroides abscessus subsp. abscessus]|nr:putative invasion protein [Mycobacteroides abscessus subsp. abscessus]